MFLSIDIESTFGPSLENCDIIIHMSVLPMDLNMDLIKSMYSLYFIVSLAKACLCLT